MFGTVTLADSESSLNKAVAAAGWAKVKPAGAGGGEGGAAGSGEIEELVAASEAAKGGRLGVFGAPAEGDGVRKIKWGVSTDEASELVAKYSSTVKDDTPKGEKPTPTKVVIE